MNLSRRYFFFLGLGCFLLFLFYFPASLVEGLRSFTIGMKQGLWQSGALLKQSLVADSPSVTPVKNRNKLEAEIFLLKRENEKLREVLIKNHSMQQLINHLEDLLQKDLEEAKGFFRRRLNNFENRLNLELYSLSAPIVYRDPSYWNGTIWVGVGWRENRECGKEVIGVGSTVLSGEALIGVVEEVKERKSRVRLLTDSSLAVSVRVSRGGMENRDLVDRLDYLIEVLTKKGEKEEHLQILQAIRAGLTRNSDSLYLAKGEVYGSRHPIWKGRSEIVKGVGFNYDFEDEEGPSLELRSGKSLDQLNMHGRLALIEEGDLLVTTGMEGIFPKDLPVARVTKVHPLKEGSVSFEIEAKLCGGAIDSLMEVTVLPPLSFYRGEL